MINKYSLENKKMFEFYRNKLTYETSYDIFRRIIQEIGKRNGESDNEISDISLEIIGNLSTPTHIEEVIPKLREIYKHIPNFNDIVADVLNIKSFSKVKIDSLDDVIFLKNAVILNDILFFENPLSTVSQKIVTEKSNYAPKDLLFSEIGIIDEDSLSYIKTSIDSNIRKQKSVENELYFQKKLLDIKKWAIENNASLIKIYPDDKTFKCSLMIDGSYYNKFNQDIATKSNYNFFITNIKKMFGENKKMTFKYNNAYYKAVLKMSSSSDFFNNNEVIYISISEYSELNFELDEINLNDKDKDLLHTHLKSPSGVIVISGNKASGKKTSLLGMLKTIKKTKNNIDIISIESFLTKKVNGIDQIETDDVKTKDSFLQEKNIDLLDSPYSIIGLSDISEKEIIKAFTMAQQGKLVILTVNSSSIFNTLNILMRAVPDKSKVVENLLCLLHVGLIRKVCKSCSAEQEFSTIKEAPFFLSLDQVPITTEKVKVNNTKGCHECNEGYIGRIYVAELIDNDKIARESIINNDLDRLRLEKRSSNWRSVYESSMELLKDKKVTLDSIIESIGIYRKT